MAATSMMKEYLKRQLKYWVDNFKDDQLPRDYNAKSFARQQITLTKITLKPDKIASLLHIPPPLIVTRATCSDLTMRVPSWSAAEKFVQEPLSLRLGDLFIDIKHINECDEHVRRDYEARARTASVEPDPLGSIASMYQFATIISERLEVHVENVYVKVYEKQALRVRVEMAHFHARTTNAMWQDMRDLTDCVDRSPDGLLKTRFKYVSTQCSVYLHPPGVASILTDTQEPPPICLLHDHAIAMRVTMFGHRTSKQENWDTLSRVVDLNLETLPFDMDLPQVLHVHEVVKTLYRWMGEVETARQKNEPMLHHQILRGPLTPKKPTTGDEEAQKKEIEVSNHIGMDADEEEADEKRDDPSSSFALQVTVRFTAHALVKFHSSQRQRDVQFAVIAQHAAFNWITHQDDSHEVQVTVHDLSVRHKDKVLLHVKPARDALRVKRVKGQDVDSLFLKWRLHKLECHVENEIAAIVNEIYHSMSEIEQAATITCGTCHHKIPLDSIATHICSAGAPASGGNRHSQPASRRNSGLSLPLEKPLIDSTRMPKLRVVLSLDELEMVTDSSLFRTVQELMHASQTRGDNGPHRRFVMKMKDWCISTESKEFVGDAIFVPVLPLAFQMLECTIKGCGCVHKLQQQQQKERQKSQGRERVFSNQNADPTTSDCSKDHSIRRLLPQWPDRLFAELGHLSVQSIDTLTNSETFVIADGSTLRLSFSDGQQLCAQSTPQMSCYFHIERIRCQLEHAVLNSMRSQLAQLQDPLQGHCMQALTLFFAVVEIRNVELTLLREHQVSSAPRLKAQFRHVGGVADNHLGYLSLQTNFDFRALLLSDAVQFQFDDQAQLRSDADQKKPYENKRARRRRREEAQREHAAMRIQRAFRVFVALRRHKVDEQLRRLTHEKQVAAERDEVSSAGSIGSQRGDSESPSDPSTGKRRKSSGKSAAAALFGSAEELAAINPMKMVAAAGVLKDGVMGFVKAKQQQLETEMSELATQSKESAARFMPKYSAVKNLLSPAVMGKAVETREVEAHRSQTNGTRPHEAVDDADAASESVNGHNSGRRLDSVVEHDPATIESEPSYEKVDREDTAPQSPESTPVGDAAAESRAEGADAGGLGADETVEQEASPNLSPAEALLEALPPVVRLMVQVEEHRLCVPISPRQTIGVLCAEIVRRFNEMFANGGFISRVTLQNPQGGVFADSDVVGLIFDPRQKSELFFAYPHNEDSEIKSFVHIGPASNEPHSPSKESSTSAPSSRHASRDRVGRRTKSARAFTRCSKLPLPLVVALLANETERDLLSHVQKDSSLRTASSDEWPELALNASFLDPQKDMLQVEVAWHGKSVQATNADAFLLCLQQLGLCTSRVNSKYVGKILRDRLKMDTKNPLIRTACEQSDEFSTGNELTKDTDAKEEQGVSYASLKEVIQEDYGVYTRLRN